MAVDWTFWRERALGSKPNPFRKVPNQVLEDIPIHLLSFNSDYLTELDLMLGELIPNAYSMLTPKAPLTEVGFQKWFHRESILFSLNHTLVLPSVLLSGITVLCNGHHRGYRDGPRSPWAFGGPSIPRTVR